MHAEPVLVVPLMEWNWMPRQEWLLAIVFHPASTLLVLVEK